MIDQGCHVDMPQKLPSLRDLRGAGFMVLFQMDGCFEPAFGKALYK